MPVVVAVALAGALGALARYGLDRLIEHHVITVFPWSTLTINVTGCLLVGVAVGALVDRHHLPSWVSVGVVVGFLGAYTTFSTFAQETLDLFQTAHVILALANATGSVVLGSAAAALGATLGHRL